MSSLKNQMEESESILHLVLKQFGLSAYFRLEVQHFRFTECLLFRKLKFATSSGRRLPVEHWLLRGNFTKKRRPANAQLRRRKTATPRCLRFTVALTQSGNFDRTLIRAAQNPLQLTAAAKEIIQLR